MGRDEAKKTIQIFKMEERAHLFACELDLIPKEPWESLDLDTVLPPEI